MSTTIIGFNVSCGSETSPGLDDNRIDWLRFSIRWPEMLAPVYIDVPLVGKFPDAPGYERGDTNSGIAQRISSAINSKIASGAIPRERSGSVVVETDPDPNRPNTAPGRIVIYNAVEVNCACSQPKLKLDIFDPHPPADKRPRVRVVTPTPPNVPPPAAPPPPTDAKGKPVTTPSSKPLEPIKPPNVATEPEGFVPRGKEGLPETYGGGGWRRFTNGTISIGLGGSGPGTRRNGGTRAVRQASFPWLPGTLDQLAAIREALWWLGIDAEGTSPAELYIPRSDMYGNELTSFVISTGDYPRGAPMGCPWEVVVEYEPRTSFPFTPAIVQSRAVVPLGALSPPVRHGETVVNGAWDGASTNPLMVPLRPGSGVPPHLRDPRG